MSVLEIKAVPGSKQKSRRIGRGTGNGHGKTCGKGNKGQKSRAGAKLHPWFEGGQMPIYRRLPKRGFKSLNKKVFNIINVSALNIFAEGAIVSVETLDEKGLIKDLKAPVKLLANGELKIKGLKVVANKCSESAKHKIEKAGGSVELI